MGLDTTHGCWSGGYIHFGHFRQAVAAAAEIPLEQMEGYDLTGRAGKRPWSDFAHDPICYLLNHSDCDGEILPEHCGPLADRLEQLIGVIGPYWAAVTKRWITGLRTAAAANEPVEFH